MCPFCPARGQRLAWGTWRRRGPDHRAGAPVTFLDVRRRFQFRSIEIGRWVTEPSELFRCSVKADKAAGVEYFSLPEELCARAFEAFVQDSTCKNTFLVSGTRESEEAKLGLYPLGAERKRVNSAFRSYYIALGRALRSAEG